MRWALLLLLALVPPVWGQADLESLEQDLGDAQRTGDFPRALNLAEQMVALLQADPATPRHRLSAVSAQVESLRPIAELDSAAWDSLALAERIHTDLWRKFRGGDYDGAAAVARRQLALRRAVLTGPHYLLSSSLSWLSLALVNQGEMDEAEAASRAALRQLLELYGREHQYTARGVNALADLLRQQGRLQEAEILLRESLVARRRIFGEDHFVLAGSHNNLATLLGTQGDYAGAAEHYRAALQLVRRHRGERDRLVGTTLRNLAVVLQAEGELVESERLLREAVDIYVDAGHAPGEARARRWLAHVLLELGDLAAADGQYRTALSQFLELHGPGHSWVAMVRRGLAQVLAREGELDLAIRELRAALSVQLDLYGPNHSNTVGTQVELARVLWTQGDPAGALELLEQAAAGYEVARTEAADDWRRATLRLASPYLLRAAVLRSLGRDRDAWVASDRARARVLSELVDRGNLRRLSEADRAREEKLRLRVAAIRSELDQLRDADPPDSVAIRTAVDRQLNLQLEWSRWLRAREASYPVETERVVAPEELQTSLSGDQAMIAWLSVEDARGAMHRWASVLRRGGLDWIELPQHGADLLALAQQLGGARASALGLRMNDEVRRSAQAAHAVWVAPLLPQLDGITQLIVVPGEELIGIPVEALLDAEGVPVAESFVVHYLPSAALQARRAAPPRDDVANAFFLGDPPFGDEYAALPHTRAEIEAVAPTFARAEVRLGKDANEPDLWELVRTGRLEEFDVLHLATHALPDERRPEESSLILAAPESDAFDAVVEGRPIFDGRITAAEILASWRLSADLVTLSACETGLGRRVRGEGYLGLAHAFFHAGSRSLLVSLWKVDDEATSLLMQRFYRNRDQLGKAAALREAKRWLAAREDGAGRRPFAHPHYWAAFVLVGDG